MSPEERAALRELAIDAAEVEALASLFCQSITTDPNRYTRILRMPRSVTPVDELLVLAAADKFG